MSGANIFGSIIFGSIGFGACIYAKKQSDFKVLAAGVGLMAYPYFVENTTAVYIIGILLTACLFLFHD